jgi:hypothetical protein
MTAIAALTIADGQASPANHTFSPVSTNGSKAQWADRSPTIPAGFRTVSFEVSPPSGNRTVNKVSAGFMNPTVATINSVDQVVRYSSAQVILNIHPDSTLQERKDLLAYVANFLAIADIKTCIQNIEPVY